MKIRSILFALSTMALAVPAVAQDVPQQSSIPATMQMPTVDPLQRLKMGKGPSLFEEQEYTWVSRHFQRIGPDQDGDLFDSNRAFLRFPIILGDEGTAEYDTRGYGQLFAPGTIYNLFRTVSNNETGLLRNQEDEIVNDLAYYEQFKDARSYTIETIVTYWFHNPNNQEPLAGAKFIVFRSPENLTDAQMFANAGYRNGGIAFARTALDTAFVADITPEQLLGTVEGGNIQPTQVNFDPPLEFEAGEFAMAMFMNDEGEPVAQPVGAQTDTREWQTMVGSWARREGAAIGSNGFGAANQRYKALGLVIFRPHADPFNPDRDTIRSLFGSLVFGNEDNPDQPDPAIMDTWMSFVGVVDLVGGVKYHFGREASSQGLGDVTPNPVSADARIPFQLTEISEVKLDLFDINGTFIRNIVSNRYVPGIYSAPLEVGDLANGTYVVRMSAGQNAYTMKVNVAK